MKKVLAVFVIVSMISCAKDKKSKTESLPGTESIQPQNETVQEMSQNEAEKVLDEVFNDQIVMDIDETVFVVDNGTNRANEEMTAGIMKMLAPQPYEIVKKQAAQKPKTQNGITTVKIEEIELQGKKVFVERSMTIDEVGDKMIMMMHAIPAGEKTIMISSYFMEKEESKYIPLIEKSVISARLEN